MSVGNPAYHGALAAVARPLLPSAEVRDGLVAAGRADAGTIPSALAPGLATRSQLSSEQSALIQRNRRAAAVKRGLKLAVENRSKIRKLITPSRRPLKFNRY